MIFIKKSSSTEVPQLLNCSNVTFAADESVERFDIAYAPGTAQDYCLRHDWVQPWDWQGMKYIFIGNFRYLSICIVTQLSFLAPDIARR